MASASHVIPLVVAAFLVFLGSAINEEIDPLKVAKSLEEQVDSALEALDSDGQFTAFLSLLHSNSRCIDDFKSLSSGLTLFAPIDAAFAEESVQRYLEKLSKKQTRQLLEFHGLPRYYSQSHLEGVFDQMIRTVASEEDEDDEKITFQLRVQSDYSVNSTLSVGQIVSEAFDAFPVVVYVINKVLIPVDIEIPLPPPPPAPVSQAVAESLQALHWSPFFRTFVRLLHTSQVIGELQSLPGFTLFAPTDQAFWSLPPEVKHKLEDVSVLAEVLKYHTVPAYYPPWSLGFVRTPVSTLASNGAFDHQLVLRYFGGLKVSVETGVVRAFVRGIVFNRNPVVIYTVDHVLLPKEIF